MGIRKVWLTLQARFPWIEYSLFIAVSKKSERILAELLREANSSESYERSSSVAKDPGLSAEKTETLLMCLSASAVHTT